MRISIINDEGDIIRFLENAEFNIDANLAVVRGFRAGRRVTCYADLSKYLMEIDEGQFKDSEVLDIE